MFAFLGATAQTQKEKTPPPGEWFASYAPTMEEKTASDFLGIGRALQSTYYSWRNTRNCTTAMSITFQSKLGKKPEYRRSIKRLSFDLSIKSKNNKQILYKNYIVHFKTPLNDGETAPSPYFNLEQDICGIDLEDCVIETRAKWAD